MSVNMFVDFRFFLECTLVTDGLVTEALPTAVRTIDVTDTKGI